MTEELVIYSALLGGYEKPIIQPHSHEIQARMIMLTDDPDRVRGSGWEAVHVNPAYPTDMVRSARRLKILGHPSLAEARTSLWIDNRVVIKPEVLPILRSLPNFDIALPRHSYRKSLIEEFQQVIASGYDDPQRVRETLSLGMSMGLDLSLRPLWTGFLFRRRSDELQATMQRWMEFLLLGSRRDQLSLQMALMHFEGRVVELDLDNQSSAVHHWVPVNEIQRSKQIQVWKPRRRTLKLRLADAARRNPYLRRGARVFERAGRPLPTLDQPRTQGR